MKKNKKSKHYSLAYIAVGIESISLHFFLYEFLDT
jgi:hypothetical protein